MNEVLMYYKDNFALKNVLAYIAGIVFVFFAFDNIDVLSTLVFGVVIGTMLSITVMVFRPLSPIVFLMVRPLTDWLSLPGVLLGYLISLLIPFAVVGLSIAWLVDVNEFIFVSLFVILSIANLGASIYFVIDNFRN